MKIAIDARTLGDCPSGIGIYLYDFIKALLADSENTGSKLAMRLLTDIEESEQKKPALRFKYLERESFEVPVYILTLRLYAGFS